MIDLDEHLRQRAWILMDGAELNAPRFVYEHDDQPELEYLYLGTAHETAMEISPCLVKPSTSSRIWSEQTRWRDHAVVLICDEPMSVVADHLRSLLSVKLPDGAYSYLRFYSPKQLCRLMPAFTELEQSRFSGPVTEWLAFKSDGEWHRFMIDGGSQARCAREEGWFVLSDQHLRALSTMARDEFVNKLGRHLSIDDSSELNELIRQADSFGFRTEKDVSSYAELAVVHGERIKHPELQGILSSSEVPAGKRLSEVDKRLAYGVAS